MGWGGEGGGEGLRESLDQKRKKDQNYAVPVMIKALLYLLESTEVVWTTDSLVCQILSFFLKKKKKKSCIPT